MFLHREQQITVSRAFLFCYLHSSRLTIISRNFSLTYLSDAGYSDDKFGKAQRSSDHNLPVFDPGILVNECARHRLEHPHLESDSAAQGYSGEITCLVGGLWKLLSPSLPGVGVVTPTGMQ